eukprot:850591-Rhodomonas_salina.1
MRQVASLRVCAEPALTRATQCAVLSAVLLLGVPAMDRPVLTFAMLLPGGCAGHEPAGGWS